MLRLLNELKNYTILTKDGESGKVIEFLFDDTNWIIRYAVINIRKWLSGGDMLVSSQSFEQPDATSKMFQISLVKEEIKNSPSLPKDRVISREYEKELIDYYNLPEYWSASRDEQNENNDNIEELKNKIKTTEEFKLRGVEKFEDFIVHATDSEIGNISNFLVDDETWMIKFIVVEAGKFLKAKKILLSPEWIAKIDWEYKAFTVNINAEKINNSPEFDPNKLFQKECEEVLYDYYGNPHYGIKNK